MKSSLRVANTRVEMTCRNEKREVRLPAPLSVDRDHLGGDGEDQRLMPNMLALINLIFLISASEDVSRVRLEQRRRPAGLVCRRRLHLQRPHARLALPALHRLTSEVGFQTIAVMDFRNI